MVLKNIWIRIQKKKHIKKLWKALKKLKKSEYMLSLQAMKILWELEKTQEKIQINFDHITQKKETLQNLF
jgi:quinolinate synthase